MENYTNGSRLLQDKTVPITVIAERLNLSPKRKSFNKNDYLPITYLKASQLKVATDIQRIVIISMIKGAKLFDEKLARPLYVFKRPNGDYVVTDGQHTAIIAILYTEERGDVILPCQIDIHPSHYTIEECEAAEAQKFRELNSKRRQAGKVDRLRADIAEGLDDALQTLSDLVDMGVHVERLGNEDGPEVHGYSKLMEAHRAYGLKNVRLAIELYQKLQFDSKFRKWNNIEKPLNGGLIGGLTAVYYFIREYLGEGDKRFALETFLDDYLGKFKPKDLLEGTAGVSQAVLIARKIIISCNTQIDLEHITKKNGNVLEVNIGEELLSQAGLGDPSKMKRELTNSRT